MGGLCFSSSFLLYLDQLAEVKEEMDDGTPYCGYKMNAASVDTVQAISVYPYRINFMSRKI